MHKTSVIKRIPWERYSQMYPRAGQRSDSWDDQYQPPHKYSRDSQQLLTSMEQRIMQTIENYEKLQQNRDAALLAQIIELQSKVANLETDNKILEEKVDFLMQQSLQKEVVVPNPVECLLSLGRGRGNTFRNSNLSSAYPGTPHLLIPRFAADPHIFQKSYYTDPGVIANAADETLALPRHQLQNFSDSAIISTVRPQIRPPFTVQADQQSTVFHMYSETKRNYPYESGQG